MSGDDVFIESHIVFREKDISLKGAHQISDQIENQLMNIFPSATITLHLDIDIVPETCLLTERENIIRSNKSENYSRDKKLDIEKLLSSNDINNSIVEFDDFISELCVWGDNLEKLTVPQKNFYYNQNLEREINNG
jgi:hypothetical protein